MSKYEFYADGIFFGIEEMTEAEARAYATDLQLTYSEVTE